MAATANSRKTVNWIENVCQRWSAQWGWKFDFQTISEEHGHEQAESGGLAQQVTCGEETLGHVCLRQDEQQANVHSNFGDLDTAKSVLKSLAVTLGDYHTLQSELAARDTAASALLQLGQDGTSDEPVQQTIDRLLEVACDLSGFRSAGVFLLEPDAQHLQLQREFHCESRSLPHSRRRWFLSPDAHVMRHKTPIALDRNCDSQHARWLPADCQTAVCLPMFRGAFPLGTFWVYERRRRHVHIRDRHLLTSVACQLSDVLERSALRAQRRSAQRLRADVQVAADNSISRPFETVAKSNDLDLAGFCSSQYEVGGDICEALPWHDGRLGLAVGDASGNGVSAAMMMAAARGVLHGLAAKLPHTPNQSDNSTGSARAEALRCPVAIMQRLNAALYALSASHQFMSFFFGFYEKQTRSLVYTNAGHPPPLILRGNQVIELKSHGLLAGILPETPYATSTVSLKSGDRLVAFTDGITEASNTSRELFRSGGIVKALRESSAATAADMVQAICRRLEIHSSGGAGDDRSLLVMRVL